MEFLTLKEVPERFLKDYVMDYTDDQETKDTESLDTDLSTSFIKKQVIDPSIRFIRKHIIDPSICFIMNHIIIPSISHLFSLRDGLCHFFVSKFPKKSTDNHLYEKIIKSKTYKIISEVAHTYYYCSVGKVEDLKKAKLFLLFRMIWCATHFFLIASGIKQLGVNVFTMFPGMSVFYTVYNFYWAMFYRYNYLRCSRVFEKGTCYDLKRDLSLDDFDEKSDEYVRFNDFVATASLSQLKRLRNYLKSLQVEGNICYDNQTLSDIEISFRKNKKLKLRRNK